MMLPEILETFNISSLSFEEKVEKIGIQMLAMEQVDCPVIHRFGPGIYIREMQLAANSFIIGHVHKQEHLNVLLKGSCTLLKGDGTVVECKAPMIFTAPAGRKVARVHEDMVWLNIYSTNEKDVEKLEEMFLDKGASPWDNAENIKFPLLQDMSFIKESQDDFLDACILLGFTPEQVWEMSSYEEDLISFPNGDYSCIVASSKIHGKGLFATSPIKKGQVIAPARLDGKRTPAGRYTNHGVLPNAEMQITINGDVFLVAIDDIKGSYGGTNGEEITVDYYKAFINTREQL